MSAVEASFPPGMPGDKEGPAFGEPWHAEAFSLALALRRQGAFDWGEWVAVFSGVLRDMPAEPGESVEAAYYRCWLVALESVVADKGLVSPDEMALRKAAWRRAYLRTPHGRPVALEAGGDEAALHESHDAGERHHDHHDHHDDGPSLRAARPGPVMVSRPLAGGASD